MKLFKRKHGLQCVQKLGRKGHNQYGVDFTGLKIEGENRLIYGGQSKNHEIGKSLSLKDDVLNEIIKAKDYKPTLYYYEIYTSSKRDPNIQKIVQAINGNLFNQLKEFLEKYKWKDKDSFVNLLRTPFNFLVEIVFGDDIQLMLNDDPVWCESIIKSSHNAMLVVTQHNVQLIEDNLLVTDNQQISSIDNKLKSIREYINNKDDISANIIINELEEDVNKLSEAQARRYYAYIGYIYELKGKRRESSEYFSKASEYLSSEFESLRLKAIAEVNCDNIHEAFELSTKIINDFPDNPLGWALWIACTSSDLSFEDIEQKIPDDIIDNPDVLGNLVCRANRLFKDQKAEEYSLKLIKICPEDPVSNELYARSILSQYSDCNYNTVFSEEDKQKLMVVINSLNIAISKVGERGSIFLRSELFYLRAVAFTLNKTLDTALINANKAYELNQDEPEICFLLASIYCHNKLEEKAIGILRDFIQNRKSIKLSLRLVELLINKEDNLFINYAKELVSNIDPFVSGIDEIEQFLLIDKQIDVYILSICNDQLGDLIDKFEKYNLDSVKANAFQSKIALHNKDKHKSRDYILEAYKNIEDSTIYDVKRYVSVFLIRNECYLESLNLLKRIVKNNKFDENSKNLFECAKRIKDYKSILDYALDLRENNVFYIESFEYEYFACTEINEWERAKKITETFLLKTSNERDKKHIFFRHATLLYKLGHTEFIDKNLVNYPLVQEVDNPGYGLDVCQFIYSIGLIEEALKYSYELYRKFPDTLEANKSLQLFIPYTANCSDNCHLCIPPNEVHPGCAVLIEYNDCDDKEWIVIEEEYFPKRSLREFSLNDPLSSELIGKKINETVILNPDQLGEKRIIVREIKSKYMFRVQDSIEFVNKFYPEDRSFVRFNLPINDNGETDFQKFFDLIDHDAKDNNNLINNYCNENIPISLISKARSTDESKIIAMLIEHEIPIICSYGTLDEKDNVNKMLKVTDKLALDPTSLTTFRFFDIASQIGKMHYNIFITEGMLNSLRDELNSIDKGESLSIYKKGANLYKNKITKEQCVGQKKFIREFISQLENSCNVVGGSVIYEIDEKKREFLLKHFGTNTTESIALAIRHNCPLLTDDKNLADLLSCYLNVDSLCTHSLLTDQINKYYLDNNFYDRTTLNLLGYYKFISINRSLAIKSGHESNWNVDTKPLSDVVRSLRDVSTEWKLFISGDLLKNGLQTIKFDYTAERFVISILNSISSGPDSRYVLTSLLRNMHEIFGLDVLNESKAREIIKIWIVHNKILY